MKKINLSFEVDTEMVSDLAAVIDLMTANPIKESLAVYDDQVPNAIHFLLDQLEIFCLDNEDEEDRKPNGWFLTSEKTNSDWGWLASKMLEVSKKIEAELIKVGHNKVVQKK